MNDAHTTRELIHEVISDVQEIIRSEVRLAKTEVKEEGAKAAGAAGMFAGAGVLAVFGLGLMEGMGVVLWAMLTPLWIAFLIMAVINLAAAGILYAAGAGAVAQSASGTEDHDHTEGGSGMGEESDQIKKHIEDKRQELGAHLNELEYRVKSATDWRAQMPARAAPAPRGCRAR